MIQYYKDLIATVTYDEIVAWINKQPNSIKRGEHYSMMMLNTEESQHITVFVRNDQFTIDNKSSIEGKCRLFQYLSEELNKPIDHIVHEMKNVQQPDNIDRLKAITNDQWRKFAEKYNLEFEIDCNDQFCIGKESSEIIVHAKYLWWVRDLLGRRQLFDRLLFFKNILAKTVSEFEYAQNIHDLITELEAM